MFQQAARAPRVFIVSSCILCMSFVAYLLSIPLVLPLQDRGYLPGYGWGDLNIYEPLVWMYRQSPTVSSFLDWYSTLLTGPPTIAPAYRTSGGVI
jgi:hypothetical protein